MAGRNARKFANVLEPRFAPVLIADGFAAQHNGWMRLRDPVINWLDVQSASDDESCCVNLGIHMTFQPKPGNSDGSTVPSEISFAGCRLAYRLAWEGGCDHWWSYNDGELAAADIVACYEERGRSLYEKFALFPHPFSDIAPDDFDDDALSDLIPLADTGKLLFLARVHDFLGNAEFARRFSEMGFATTSKMASGARFAFKNILRKNGAPVPKGR